MKNKRSLRWLTLVFIVALMLNSIIGGSHITLAVMAACALYAVYISLKIDRDNGDYERKD